MTDTSQVLQLTRPSPKCRLRERNGCLTCRDRKKKCDALFPACEQCRRLNLICRREDPRNPVPRVGRPRKQYPRDERVQIRSESSTTAPVVCSCILIPQSPQFSFLRNQEESDEKTGSQRLILRYYTQSFTELLTTTRENNCFLSVFLPMATESPLVLDSILAWSSTHLALRDNSYEGIAISNRCKALNSLSGALGGSDRNNEMELASCLIHCAMESISGDTTHWFEHHVGAFEVIKAKARLDETEKFDLSRFSRTFEGRWLLSSFAYHDIMMAVVEDRKPLLVAGEYWALPDSSTAHSYFGLASRIMFLISEISVLNVNMVESSDVGEEVYSSAAREIEQSLVSWRCNSTEVTTQETMLVNLAESYRSAALIHLYRTIRRHRSAYAEVATKKITEHVNAILKGIGQMPVGCLAESSLLFPLFMAGGESEDPDAIESIRQRMQGIIDARGFHNMEVALKVLEEVWHLRATGVVGPGGGKIDWKDVVKRRQWKLSIT